MNERPRALRYIFDKLCRGAAMRLMNRITIRAHDEQVDFRRENIKRILIVRGLFRLGDSILATAAILLMRQNFPAATIDFVGPDITKKLFQQLPINRYYEIWRAFPKAGWSYPMLLNRLRQENYDLAFDASGSSAALGSFIVGFSGARFRIGVRGRWDRWFNIRVARPRSVNKYGNLPSLFSLLGLNSPNLLPRLPLAPVEAARGKKRLNQFFVARSGPIVGIFVGGRKSRGKRWPVQNFLRLAMLLKAHRARPILFLGPEEKDSLAYLESILPGRVPVVFEPEITRFASLVANCQLFVACDSGPVHLACALRVRTVAIFLKDDCDRWGPPCELSRIVFCPSGVDVTTVLQACQVELSPPGRHAYGDFKEHGSDSE